MKLKEIWPTFVQNFIWLKTATAEVYSPNNLWYPYREQSVPQRDRPFP